MAILTLCLFLTAAFAAVNPPAGAETGGGVDADAGLLDAVAEKLAENPELRRIEEEAKERTERRKRRRQGQEPGAEDDEPLPDGAMEKMLREVPGGPPQLEDLRAEAAEERAKLAMESIESATLAKAAPEARDLYRTYLIEVFFRGNAGTDVGQLIQRGLTTPDGWREFPTQSHAPLPPPIAGMYGGGHVTLDPARGTNLMVVSHEWYHHTGHPDEGPDSAYVWMGREFGGGGLGGQEAGSTKEAEEESGAASYAFQCN